MTYRCLRLAVLAAALVGAAAAPGDVVTIGFQAALEDGGPDCTSSWVAWRGATAAIEQVRASRWWKETGLQIALEYLPASTPYQAWKSAEEFIGRTPSCPGVNDTAPPAGCRVTPIALVGPRSDDATKLVQLVAKHSSVPQLAYSATAASLAASTEKRLAFADRVPFFRLSYTDAGAMGALWSFVQRAGWRQVAILHSRDEHGVDSAVALQRIAGGGAAETGGNSGASGAAHGSGGDSGVPVVTSTYSFDPQDVASMDAALAALKADPDGTRVVVLLTFSEPASALLQCAAGARMTGKGWVWLGSDWVREATWAAPVPAEQVGTLDLGTGGRRAQAAFEDPARVRARATVRQAMQGAIGVVPSQLDAKRNPLVAALTRTTANSLSNAAAGTLAALQAASGQGAGALPAPVPSATTCPYLYEPPASTTGLRFDGFAQYAFDAVWAAASAAADVILADKGSSAGLTPARVWSQLDRLGVTRVSPLTDSAALWLANGDRSRVPLSLVNVQGEELAEAGVWLVDLPKADMYSSATRLIAGTAKHGDGKWLRLDMSAVRWPGGQTLVPPDRAGHVDHASAAALMIMLVGVVASFFFGALLHRYEKFQWLPESAVTVLVGAGFGIMLRWMATTDVRALASFNPEFFMLILLPIIIFESGYALDLKPFFTQLLSINAFAVGGTLISTFVIGGIVYTAGQQGSIIALSFEESMAFASLLSATDPVATLAVFASKRVDPTLYSLVYGESVINDAVSLVLFRSFTGFLVAPVTSTASLAAVGSFILVLVLSVVVGYIVGWLTTILFRFVHVASKLEASGLQALHDRRKREAEAAIDAQIEAEARADAASAPAVLGLGSGSELVDKLERLEKLAPLEDAKKAFKATLSTLLRRGRAEHGDSAADDLAAGIGETALLLLLAYASFALAEAVSLSGIVASLFCGICFNSYTRRLMSKAGQRVSSAVFKMLASLADTAIFFEIGLNIVLMLGVGEYHASFITVTLIACLVARAANIFPLSFILNRGRKDKIGWRMQTQMWHAGLRGAIAFATSLTFPSQHRSTVVNATASICLFTIFALGGTTTTTLTCLRIPHGITHTREQRVAAVAATTRDSRIKRLLASFDESVRKVIYGPVLMELMQKRKDAKARRAAGGAATAAAAGAAAGAAGSGLADSESVAIVAAGPADAARDGGTIDGAAAPASRSVRALSAGLDDGRASVGSAELDIDGLIDFGAAVEHLSKSDAHTGEAKPALASRSARAVGGGAAAPAPHGASPAAAPAAAVAAPVPPRPADEDVW